MQSACVQRDSNTVQDDIFYLPKSFTIESNINEIIVIPRAGCTGCIDEVVTHLIKRLDSLKNTKIVFTDIEGIKELKIRLGERCYHPAIYLDTSNVFYEAGKLQSIYPQRFISLGNRQYKKERFVVYQ
jgi:hypothetical protein